MAMTLVSTVTVGSGGAASILWSNIPQSGKDLLLLISGRNTSGTSAGPQQDLGVKFNGGTLNSGVTSRLLFTSGSGASSNTNNALSFGFINLSNYTTSTFSNSSVYVCNYAGTTNKSYSTDTVQETNSSTNYQALIANVVTSSTGITSIELLPGSGTLAEHSSASLYIIS